MKLNLGLIAHKENLKISKTGVITTVFDPVRKRHVQLTPEEFVRQLFVQYLIKVKDVEIKKIMVEREIKVGDRKKRFDLVILDKKNDPYILVECKSHNELVNNKVFEQVGHYNLSVKAKYLIITNGMNSYAAEIDFANKDFVFLSEFPSTDCL